MIGGPSINFYQVWKKLTNQESDKIYMNKAKNIGYDAVILYL